MSLLLLLNNSGDSNPSSSAPLFISGHESVQDSNTTLFIEGVPGTNNNNIPLHTISIGNENNNITLFMEPIGVDNSNVTLFVEGGYPRTSEVIPLFIDGIGVSNKTATLFVTGVPPSSNNNIPLHTIGIGFETKRLNLYTAAPVPVANSKNMTLAITGATQPDISSAITLFIKNDFGTGMNLFIQGPISQNYNKKMNLFTKGIMPSVNGNIPLFLFNEQTAGFATLFISGRVDPGVYSANMNLYLERPTSDVMPLTIMGPYYNINEMLSLYLAGAYLESASMTLAMLRTTGLGTGRTTLYTRGY